MKKMRKILSALLAMSMVFTLLAVSASAAPAATTAVPTISADIPAAVRALAYSDIEKASPTQKEAILEARRQIVYGDQAWTVDGAMRIIKGDGTVITPPEFSDLFPGWDLDEISGLTPDTFHTTGRASNFTVRYDQTIDLEPQRAGVNASTFYRFNANGKPVYAWAVSINRSEKYNIGFNNEDTGKDLGWWPGLVVESDPTKRVQAELTTREGVRYGVRASTPALQKVSALMLVSENKNDTHATQG